MEPVLENLKSLHDLGFAIHLLRPRSKKPINSEWTSGPRLAWDELKDQFRAGDNVGVRLGRASKIGNGFLCAIDCDVKSEDPKHVAEMRRHLARLFPVISPTTPNVVSGRGNGSCHIYGVSQLPAKPRKVAQSKDRVKVKMPSATKTSKLENETLSPEEIKDGWRIRPAWEISIMGEGQQTVLPISIHPDTGREYKWGHPILNVEDLIFFDVVSAEDVPKTEREGAYKFIAVTLTNSGLSADIIELIESGKDCVDKSAGLYKATIAMIQIGFSDIQILSILTDKSNFLGSTPYEHVKSDDRSRAASWLKKYTVDTARRKYESSIPGLPKIITSGRQFRHLIADTWPAIHKANEGTPSVFLRANHLVKTVQDRQKRLQIATLGADEVYGVILRVADWLKVTMEGLIPAKPSRDIARDISVNPDSNLPRLESVINSPVLSSKGVLIYQPGYYGEEALIYDPLGLAGIPGVPEKPTAEDIDKAREFIRSELFADFPFVTDSDQAHAFAAILLPICRRLINGPTPAHIISAPTPGSGKNLLSSAIGICSIGRSPEVRTLASDENEIKKMITSELIRGPQIVLLDNLKQSKLDSPALAAVLTTTEWTDRILGASIMGTFPNHALWLMTGNNPEFSTELARRCIRIRLDPRRDRPWQREKSDFRHKNLLFWANENRSALIHAVLVIVQTWLSRGRPKYQGSGEKGSFENWAEIIGGILETAGIDGFLENEDALYAAADAEGQMWRDFVGAWWDDFKSAPKTAGQLNTLCHRHELMAEVRYGGRGGDRSEETCLGKALRSSCDKVFDHYRIELVRITKQHGNKYRLTTIEEPLAKYRSGRKAGSTTDSLSKKDSCEEEGNLADLFASRESKRSDRDDGEEIPF